MMVNGFLGFMRQRVGGRGDLTDQSKLFRGCTQGQPLRKCFHFCSERFHPNLMGLSSQSADYNHSVLGGDEASDACFHIAKILSEPDIPAFYPPTGERA